MERALLLCLSMGFAASGGSWKYKLRHIDSILANNPDVRHKVILCCAVALLILIVILLFMLFEGRERRRLHMLRPVTMVAECIYSQAIKTSGTLPTWTCTLRVQRKHWQKHGPSCFLSCKHSINRDLSNVNGINLTDPSSRHLQGRMSLFALGSILTLVGTALTILVEILK